jgi:hypothetical protein
MSEYLDRLYNGEDPKTLILELESKVNIYSSFGDSLVCLITDSCDFELKMQVSSLLERLNNVHKTDADKEK